LICRGAIGISFLGVGIGNQKLAGQSLIPILPATPRKEKADYLAHERVPILWEGRHES